MIQRDYRKVGEIYFLTATYREDFSNIDSVQIPKGTPVQIIDTSNFPEIKVRDAYDSEVSIDIDFLSRDPIASLYAYKNGSKKVKKATKSTQNTFVYIDAIGNSFYSCIVCMDGLDFEYI